MKPKHAHLIHKRPPLVEAAHDKRLDVITHHALSGLAGMATYFRSVSRAPTSPTLSRLKGSREVDAECFSAWGDGEGRELSCCPSAALFHHQRRQARKLGVTRPLPGAICFVQRFSSALALWPHLHLVLPDGVFFEAADGKVSFRALPRLSVSDLEAVVARIARRLARWLERHEVQDEPRDGLALTYAAAAQAPHPPSPPRPRPHLLEAPCPWFESTSGS